MAIVCELCYNQPINETHLSHWRKVGTDKIGVDRWVCNRCVDRAKQERVELITVPFGWYARKSDPRVTGEWDLFRVSNI